jgi:hypothetical protein
LEPSDEEIASGVVENLVDRGLPQLRERIRSLSPAGASVIMQDAMAVVHGTNSSSKKKQRTTSTTRLAGNFKAKVKRVDDTNLGKRDFTRFRNWLNTSLEFLGRTGQPRTAAREAGYQGELGSGLNIVLENNPSVVLKETDYVAASYILLRVSGWGEDDQPIFAQEVANYRGNYRLVLADLRKNGTGVSV